MKRCQRILQLRTITTFHLACFGDAYSQSPRRWPWRIIHPRAKPSRTKTATPVVDAQVELIDREIQAVWSDYQMAPSKNEEDGLWCRRVYLDVLGRIPTFREMQEFGKEAASQRRSKLIQKLLYDPKYTEEFASRWSTIWTNILIGRNGGNERNSFIHRPGLEKYLRDAFARGLPYNRMVFELVTASGATKPGIDGFNGATNFLVMKVNEDNGVQATAAVSRIFLGLQVQCTQCHDHPANEWRQKEFWQFNAFFRQTRGLRRFQEGTNNIDYCELIDQDFEGDNRRVKDADTVFLLRNGEAKVAYPVFVDGRSIPTSGYVNEVNRRLELGKLMMDSPFLDKMIVNRMWAHFLGYGFHATDGRSRSPQSAIAPRVAGRTRCRISREQL